VDGTYHSAFSSELLPWHNWLLCRINCSQPDNSFVFQGIGLCRPTIGIDAARSRHIMAFLRKAWLNQAGCTALYWYLEFEAKWLCGEAGIQGADGDEFAPGKTANQLNRHGTISPKDSSNQALTTEPSISRATAWSGAATDWAAIALNLRLLSCRCQFTRVAMPQKMPRSLWAGIGSSASMKCEPPVAIESNHA
jgi:hypothetical protein